MEEVKIRSKLKTLNESLDELEDQLEPLLCQPLRETLSGLENLQQAKLQVDIPYVVYDLIFIYLKTRGIDPKTHPVIGELDRVRQYFEKIKGAEAGPEKRRNTLDQDAANRFIKHAIAQASVQRPAGDEEAGRCEVRVPAKVASKMEARVEYERDEEAVGDEEESDVGVFGDVTSGKGKGKEAVESETLGGTSAAGKKRRRPAGSGRGAPGRVANDDGEAARKAPRSGMRETSV